MTRFRYALLLGPVIVAPLAFLAAAGPAAAAPPATSFGSHVSSCARMSTGFSGAHNPSHHRVPTGHGVDGMHC